METNLVERDFASLASEQERPSTEYSLESNTIRRDSNLEVDSKIETLGEQDASMGDSVLDVGLKKRPRIWAVGGGKGGVGKSLISANFSIALARRGARVLAVDLDLGGSNLHTCLGVNPPQVGVGDWVFNRVTDLRQLQNDTSEPGLKIISGSQDPIRVMASIGARKEELMKSFTDLDFDEIVIDLGAGTADYTIDFFNAADEGILSILPEPTSVENAYRFIRAAYFKRLLDASESPDVREIVEAGMDPKNPIGIRTPADLLLIVERLNPDEAGVMKKVISKFKPHVVINQVRSQIDVDVGRAVCSVCRRYFGIEVQYSGYLDFDNSVWKAIKSKKAILQEFPSSPLATRFNRLTKALLGEERGIQ